MTTTLRDEARELVSPHKFGGDRMAALLYILSLDGGEDEQTGDAVDWQFHAARFGRRILYCDTQGFVWLDRYPSELQAVRAFEADDRSYGEYLEAQEQERQLWADGFRPGPRLEADGFMPGDAVRVDGYDGIAFRVDGFPERSGPDAEWSGEYWWHPGQRTCHMVGDDREFTFDVDDLTPLDEDEFCSGCGQIGCGWC